MTLSRQSDKNHTTPLVCPSQYGKDYIDDHVTNLASFILYFTPLTLQFFTAPHFLREQFIWI